MRAKKIDFDLRYMPRLTVPDFPQIAERWSRDSAMLRARLDGYLDVPYGPDATQTMDIFRSRGPSKGLLMFIHGGYWRAMDKKDHTFVVPALVEAGITVAVPNYALCPTVRIRDIVMQMVQACAWLYRNGSNFGAPAQRLHVAGHSAGGHLASMMLACVWPAYARDLPRKVVQGAFAVSGLYDLTEIARVPSLAPDLRLTEKSAIEVSPAWLPPATDAPLITAVGEKENEGFHYQRDLIGRRWKRVLADSLVCPGDHHFSVIDGLATPSSPMFRAVMKMMGV